MSLKLVVFLLCFLIISIGDCASTGIRSQPVSVANRADSQMKCESDGDLRESIENLTSEVHAQQSRQDLFRASQRSVKCRKKVIKGVLAMMAEPSIDIKGSQKDRSLWQEGSILLGDLKATEALDLLIRHLDMDDGEWSVTMRDIPALDGVIRMGNYAVPKLSFTLFNSPDRSIRQHVVYCLSFIGGRAARATLKQALKSESDACVRQFIAISIRGLDSNYKKRSGFRDEWFSAFFCIGKELN